MPLMDWMVVQLKYYAGIDSFPFVIRSSAELEDILSDLSTCYGTVLYLDPRSSTKFVIPENLLLLHQEDICKASKMPKTDGEFTARAIASFIKSKRKGEPSILEIEKSIINRKAVTEQLIVGENGIISIGA